MNMETLTYIKKIPVMKGIFGAAFFIIGIIAIGDSFINLVFGGIFIAIGVHFLSSEGSQLNFKNRQYRIVKSVLGINFGKWKPCPEFEYVSVFKTGESRTLIYYRLPQRGRLTLYF